MNYPMHADLKPGNKLIIQVHLKSYHKFCAGFRVFLYSPGGIIVPRTGGNLLTMSRNFNQSYG